MSVGDKLKEFTRAISSSVSLFRVSSRNLLPGLYVSNTKPSQEVAPLVYDGDYPNINPQSYGEYLDRLGAMFNISRLPGEGDEELRSRVLFYLSENSTKSGITRAVTNMFAARGFDVEVEIRETIHDYFDGTSTTFSTPMRNPKGSLLYGLTIIITAKMETVREVERYNHVTGLKETIVFPPGVSWRRRKNPYVGSLLSAFRVNSLKYLFEDIVAAGVSIDKVIIQTAGTGGDKAPTMPIEKLVAPRAADDVDFSNVVFYDGFPLMYDGYYLVYS